MDISNIIKLNCNSCGNEFYSLLSRGITINETDLYEVFASRNSLALVFFKPTKEESNYFYYEQTEARAREAYPEFDTRRTILTDHHFETGDTHRYDPVFKSMRSSVKIAECIHCGSEASITEIIDGNEFLNRGGQFIGLEDVT